MTMSVKRLSLKSSVTGLQTETPADQCLAVQSSTEDAWCTHHQGLKRSCHCRAQNRKHMLPLQLSWMPSSLELRTILCWVLQVRILMYLYSSAACGVLSRRGVGRLRHLSCRVLWLQNLVVEKMLQVKAVLGTIDPADVSTKRLSIARLESLMYLFRLWSTAQSQLIGSDDPGRIFRHFPQQSATNASRNSQLRVLIGALSLLTLQLQGCEAHVNRHDGHSVCVHSDMDWTSWCLLALDVTVLEKQQGHTR